MLRGYKWGDLTEAERAAVRDCLQVAGGRAAVGAGTVLTLTAVWGQLRRGAPKLPPPLRYGAGGFFVLLGAYAGLLSGGPLYGERILAVPNSRIADDLRIAAGDWAARLPEEAAQAAEVARTSAGAGATPAEEAG